MYKRMLAFIVIVFSIASCSVFSSGQAELNANESVENTDGLSVITIGTGTPQYSESKASASTAIKYNGNYYIVDCGDGSFSAMEEADLDFRSIRGIFFTHHHIDHTTDFFDLYTRCLLIGGAPVNVVGPPRTENFIEFFNSVFLDDVLYRKSNVSRHGRSIDKDALTDFAKIKEITGESVFEMDGITITTAEMTHTMYDLAYKFEVDGKSIVISGDTSYDEDLIELSKGADILVIDGNLYKPYSPSKSSEREYIEPFYEYGGNFEVDPHLSFDDMVQIAREAGVKKLVITHYNSASESRIDRSVAKIKESFDGQVIYATDMMEISVEESE